MTEHINDIKQNLSYSYKNMSWPNVLTENVVIGTLINL